MAADRDDWLSQCSIDHASHAQAPKLKEFIFEFMYTRDVFDVFLKILRARNTIGDFIIYFFLAMSRARIVT